MVNFLFLETQGRKRGGGRPRYGGRLYAVKKKKISQVIQILPLEGGLSLHFNLHQGNAGGTTIYYSPEWLKLKD